MFNPGFDRDIGYTSFLLPLSFSTSKSRVEESHPVARWSRRQLLSEFVQAKRKQ